MESFHNWLTWRSRHGRRRRFSVRKIVRQRREQVDVVVASGILGQHAWIPVVALAIVKLGFFSQETRSSMKIDRLSDGAGAERPDVVIERVVAPPQAKLRLRDGARQVAFAVVASGEPNVMRVPSQVVLRPSSLGMPPSGRIIEPPLPAQGPDPRCRCGRMLRRSTR
jgi:hypothetical protein